jgi:tRNA pseudouridine13 synthase
VIAVPNDDTLLPSEPPSVSRDLDPIHGRLGPDPDDFQVDEIPAYGPSGSGPHLYVRVKKRLLTTPELVHLVAKAAGVAEPTVGHAGMKDKHAVTTQWLSLPLPCREPQSWELPDSVEVLETGMHTNKIRTGHLHGNRFTLRLVALEPEDKPRFLALWTRIAAGIFNGFGEQRFGHAGSNLHRALEWLGGQRSLHGPRARFLRKLNVSVIQSEIFNRYLTRRVEASLASPLLGEVLRLKGSGAHFVVKNPTDEQPRWDARDTLPTGPMVGSRVYPAAEDAALAIEAAATREVCPEPQQLERLNAEASGTRRDLLLFLAQPGYEWVNDQIIKISFELPAGAYATQVLRELTHRPWLSPEKPDSLG